VRQPFEVAQDDGQPLAVRQPGEFFVQGSREFGGRCGRARRRNRIELIRFKRSGARGTLAQPERGVDGDPVQPPAGGGRADGAGLADQRQERGLERVLGVGLGAEHAPTGRPHRVGVPPHEQLERGRIVRRHEPAEQVRVRNVVRRRHGRQQAEEQTARHGGSSGAGERVRPPS
jgi:hypothetical protein